MTQIPCLVCRKATKLALDKITELGVKINKDDEKVVI